VSLGPHEAPPPVAPLAHEVTQAGVHAPDLLASLIVGHRKSQLEE